MAIDFATAANVAIAVSVVVALVFGVLQTRAGARERRERLTMEAIRSFQTREFSAHFQRLRSRTMPATAAAFYALAEEEQVSFIHFAQEMEMLGLLVAQGLLGLDLVEQTLGDFVTYAWTKYQPMFQDMREQNGDPFLGEYFQWLAQRVDERMRRNPRKPAYA